ncbi:MAG TPA: hypothetical protein VGI29_06835 [Candidatus Binataceae bacterium]|jgi:hypothetical protein
MKPLAQERIAGAAAAYLEAYDALERAAERTQRLVDRLIAIALALTDTGARLRDDAWKHAAFGELPAISAAPAAASGPAIRLGKTPTSNQLLEAIADWRKKRRYLQQLWQSLPAEMRATLKMPATLD